MVGLTDRQIDFLREVANIGSGHAVTALSQLLERKVLLRVPDIKIVGIERIPEIVGSPNMPVAGLYFRVFGEGTGKILVLFPKESAARLLRGLLNEDAASLQEMEASTLKEVGNILAGAYLTAIGTVLGMVLIQSVPGMQVDIAGAVLNIISREHSQESKTALLMETQFTSENSITGYFFLVPDTNLLEVILKTFDEDKEWM